MQIKDELSCLKSGRENKLYLGERLQFFLSYQTYILDMKILPRSLTSKDHCWTAGGGSVPDGTRTSRGKPEGVDGEALVGLAGVVGEEAVEGVELSAVRLVAGRQKTTCSTSGETSLESDGLGESGDVVEDDSPPSLGVP